MAKKYRIKNNCRVDKFVIDYKIIFKTLESNRDISIKIW